MLKRAHFSYKPRSARERDCYWGNRAVGILLVERHYRFGCLERHALLR